MFMPSKHEDANNYVSKLMNRIYSEHGFTLQMLFLLYYSVVLFRGYVAGASFSILTGIAIIVSTYLFLCTRKVVLKESHNVSRRLRDYKHFKASRNMALSFILAFSLMDVVFLNDGNTESNDVLQSGSLVEKEISGGFEGSLSENGSETKSPDELGFTGRLIMLLPFTIYALISAVGASIVEMTFTFMLFSSKKTTYYYSFLEMMSIYIKYIEYLIIKLLPIAIVFATVQVFTPLLGLSVPHELHFLMIAISSYYAAIIIFSLASYEERNNVM